MTDREPYISAAAVSAWLGVTQQTVREWALAGVIRGYQPGGRSWLFLASEIAVDIARSRPHALEQVSEPTPLARRPQRVAGERVTSLRELVRQGRL